MKHLFRLWVELARECGSISGVSITRDVFYVSSRYEDEGLSFFTITLPAFGADFERGLDQGYVDSDLFQGYAWAGGLPKFLRGFLCRVFHPRTGRIHAKPSVEAIVFIRQLCHLLKKIELPCTPERELAACVKYLQIEEELSSREQSGEWTDADYVEFSRMATLIFGEELSEIDRMVYQGEILPKHGPGAVSDRLVGNQKWNLPTWTNRLENIFPYVDFGLPNHRYWEMSPEYLTPEQEPPVKVTLVPKTLKTPRVIAIEPTHMQFMQQGLLVALVDLLEAPDKGWEFVGFSEQEPNRLLAQKGSLDGSLATIDLSDASDRVSNFLVQNGLVRNFPWIKEALDATRSRSAVLPPEYGGETVELRKFASMGSAVCFPIEAMVFTTIVFLGIQRQLGRSLTGSDLKSLDGLVRVYGDDIVVPTQYAVQVAEELAFWGLAVNTKKSFWTGRFRESCGGDYYRGEWVTPIRCTKVAPSTWNDAEEAEAWFALSNALHKAGYWSTAAYAAGVLQETYGKLPVVSEASQGMGLESFCGVPEDATKDDPYLHRPFVKALVVEHEIPSSKIEGPAALYKCFRFDWSDPVDAEHLLRSGRPKRDRAKVRRRWVPV